MRYCSISFEILPIDFPGLRILSDTLFSFVFYTDQYANSKLLW